MSKITNIMDELFNEGKKSQAGFDLTNIKADKWIELLGIIGASTEPVRLEDSWEWKGKGVVIYSGNNPITGEYAGSRRPEKDYASYIGIEGDKKKVQLVFEFIKIHGDYKGLNATEREYI